LNSRCRKSASIERLTAGRPTTMKPKAIDTVLPSRPENSRLDYLDATRAFALVLGIVFHAGMSFLPFFCGWAVQDVSTSQAVAVFFTTSHIFRMETFFLLAGLLGHVTYHRKGTGSFVRSRLLRIVLPFLLGWFILRPLLVSGWTMGSASLRGSYDFWAAIRGGFGTLSGLPSGLFTGTHLWFLYYLAMVTGLTLALREVAVATGLWRVATARRADSVVAWLARSRLSLPLFAVPTAFALWFMHYWGMETPDQTLLPRLPVLSVYWGFFAFGWMLGRQTGLIPQFARLTTVRWLIAATGIAIVLSMGRFQLDPGNPRYAEAHVAYLLGYALAMWSLVFLTIGVFKRLCSRPNPAIRYLADSSYWLYLVHLPIVVWLQVATAEVPLHWSLKLGLISTLTIAVGLFTYDLFVRSTFIGWVLNGRTRDRVLPSLLGGGDTKRHGWLQAR